MVSSRHASYCDNWARGCTGTSSDFGPVLTDNVTPGSPAYAMGQRTAALGRERELLQAGGLPRGPGAPRAPPGEGGAREMPWNGGVDPSGLGAGAGFRAALPGLCIGRGTVEDAPAACAAAGAGAGVSRETPEEPRPSEAWTRLGDEGARRFEAAFRQGGFVACAADAYVGAPRETPAEPRAAEAWPWKAPLSPERTKPRSDGRACSAAPSPGRTRLRSGSRA